MGGAERAARAARKRRQQELAAKAARAATPASIDERTRKFVVAGAALAVIAALVGGGLWWINSTKNATEGTVIPAKSGTGTEDVQQVRDGVVVVVGAEDAPTTIDVYADFLCPACRAFEEANAGGLSERIAAGELRVRQHMLPLLVTRSDPPGYSLDAANASLCAADAGEFSAFHDSLFAAQPEEGTRGYDKSQLVKLGNDLGIEDPSFARCVRGGVYDQRLNAALEETVRDRRLQQDFGDGPSFGTPTVVANGTIVDWSSSDWLAEITKGTGG